MGSALLLVEDDESLGATLKERLDSEGYRVTWVRSKQEARALLEKSNPDAPRPFDLVILDIGLPDGSGLDLARDIRYASNAPIVFLTAMTSAEFRLEGFEIGAEDFIPKPFHLKELLLRVAKVIDKTTQGGVLVEKGFTLDCATMSVTFSDGKREVLSKREFLLLRYLIEKSPAIVTREEVVAKAWKEQGQQSLRSVDNSIVKLRQLLDQCGHQFIRSIRGVGYQWMRE